MCITHRMRGVAISMKAMGKLPKELGRFEKIAESGGSMYIPALYILQGSGKFSDVFADVLAKMETYGNGDPHSGFPPSRSSKMSSMRIGGTLFTQLETPYDAGSIGSYVAEVVGVYFSFRILGGDEAVVYKYPATFRVNTIDLLQIVFSFLPDVAVSQQCADQPRGRDDM